MNKCLLFFLMMSVAITSLVMASPTPSVWRNSNTTALDTDTAALDTDTAALDTDTAALDTDTTALDTDTAALDTDTAALDTDTTALDTDTAALDTDTAALDTDTAALDTDTAALDTDTAALEPDQGAVVKRSKRATDNELLAFTGGMAGGGATVGLATLGPAGAVVGGALGALTGTLISLYKIVTR